MLNVRRHFDADKSELQILMVEMDRTVEEMQSSNLFPIVLIGLSGDYILV